MARALAGLAPWPDPPAPVEAPAEPPGPDLADVRGQPAARYALEVAAAGGHHLLLVGPPGAGKTMLARRLPGLLPDLPGEHALEATCIHSAAGLPLPAGGLIRVARAAAKVAFPARLQLVAAMNPCPCGEGGAPGGGRCSPTARARYDRRISGPL